jgi:hypothetical protein
VVVDGAPVLVVRKIEIRGEMRSGEVAPSDDDLGENSPNLVSIATAVDKSAIHARSLQFIMTGGIISFTMMNVKMKTSITMILAS